MEREFEIGDIVILTEMGVVGKVVKFYIPTSCEEQTMVETADGREFHAPTRMWAHYNAGMFCMEKFAGIDLHTVKNYIDTDKTLRGVDLGNGPDQIGYITTPEFIIKDFKLPDMFCIQDTLSDQQLEELKKMWRRTNNVYRTNEESD